MVKLAQILAMMLKQLRFMMVLTLINLPMNLYLFLLSEEIDVYAAEQESAIRVKDGKIEILGPVYLKIQKLVETL